MRAGRAPSADQQDAERALSARLDLQAGGGDGADGGGRRSRGAGELRRRLHARQPALRLPRRARPDEPAPGDRQELQHLFLHDGPPDRDRALLGDGETARPRPALRRAPGRLAKLRHHPRSGLEAAPLPAGMEPVRHAQRRDRPGLRDPQPAPARGDGGAGRLGPRHPAPADRRAAGPRRRPCPSPRRASRRCAPAWTRW